jgi:hypothetical protein
VPEHSSCPITFVGAKVHRQSPTAKVHRKAKTNHEQTLSVPYVFCNPLIWSEQSKRCSKLKIDDDAGRAGFRRRRKRLADQQAIGGDERDQQRGILRPKRRPAGGPVESAPGKEADSIALPAHLQPIAVVLDLVDRGAVPYLVRLRPARQRRGFSSGPG